MPPYGGKGRRGYGGYKSRGFKKRRHESFEKKVEKVLQKKSEVKFFDFTQTDASLATGMQEIDAVEGDFDILQGDGPSERIGRQVTLTKIFWRWNLLNTITSAGTNETVRLFIILDKQVNGAVSPPSLIWTDEVNWQSFNGMLEIGRFRTLYDSGPLDLQKTAGAGNGTTNSFSGETRSGEVFLKNLKIKLQFDASTGTISDLTQNHISFWAAARVGGIVSVTSEVRLRYMDL